MPRRNRLRAWDQWPADAKRRRRLARLDLDFCRALGRVLFPSTPGVIPGELCATWQAAKRALRAPPQRN